MKTMHLLKGFAFVFVNVATALLAAWIVVNHTGCSTSSTGGSPKPDASQTAQATTQPEDGFDFLHPKESLAKPTANPWWYGQGPYGKKPVMADGFSGSFGPPVYQASWAQPNWYIDPANSTGCASDVNKTCSLATCGTTGDGPCVTYAQVAARWGTYTPRLRQATVITYLSSGASTDPIIARPYIENGGSLVIGCQLPAAAQTGTLASVVAMNRATSTLLTATLGAGGVAGQLVQNTTHPSLAWIYANSSGNAWFFTRPNIAQNTLPYAWFNAGSPVDTWANGDAFSVYTPYTIYVEDFRPTVVSGNSVFGLSTYLANNCGLGTISSGAPHLNVDVSLTQTYVPFAMTLIVDATPGSYQFFVYNSYVGRFVFLSNGGSYTNGNNTASAFVGGLAGLGPVGASVSLSQGTILAAPYTVGIGANSVLNDVYVASGGIVGIQGETQVTGYVWGPGALNVQGLNRLTYPSGAGQAVANFLLTGGIKINNATTACSHSAASPDVVSCGITLNAANLDAAQGVAGFGGLAYVPGGGSVTNGGF